MISKKKLLLFKKQAEIMKSIAQANRLAVVAFLKDGEQCVCDIARHVGAERSNISRHLSVMVSAGVLDYRKDGLQVIYRLKTPCVLECLDCITNCLKEQIKEDKKLLSVL
ncbi:MAG: winged helix-turn-helix transcriptional regulator [Sedimentisphaerales bacterium]|nr:winged helix-turn-helix transcriptional regulator [Sedimentisphaerales bacterium]